MQIGLEKWKEVRRVACKREDRFRHNTIAFWLSDEEKNQVEAKIVLSGISKGEYYRKERDKSNQEFLAKHDLRASTLKVISKEADAETKSMKSVAVPVNNLFGGEEYVKVKKSDWNKIMDAFSRAVSRNHLLEKYEKKIFALEKKTATLTDQIEKLKKFVASRGLGEVFAEFVKSLTPKSFKQKLEEKKADAEEQNRQRKTTQQKVPDKKKKLQQEM